MTTEQLPVLSFVGFSGSGKTTLLEKVIFYLKKHYDLTIVTIKHDAHHFDIDHPGKDSYRFKQAGSDTVILTNDHQFALIQDVKKGLSLEEACRRAGKADLYLSEGYKHEDQVKIAVFRDQAKYDELQASSLTNVVALATDMDIESDLPVFDINDEVKIGEWIIRYFSLENCKKDGR